MEIGAAGQVVILHLLLVGSTNRVPDRPFTGPHLSKRRALLPPQQGEMLVQRR